MSGLQRKERSQKTEPAAATEKAGTKTDRGALLYYAGVAQSLEPKHAGLLADIERCRKHAQGRLEAKSLKGWGEQHATACVADLATRLSQGVPPSAGKCLRGLEAFIAAGQALAKLCLALLQDLDAKVAEHERQRRVREQHEEFVASVQVASQ